jgi:hypothetical protein
MAISEIYAANTDLASTKWVCTTNTTNPSVSQTTSPSTNQIAQKTKENLAKDKQNTENSYATSSLSTAFSSAVQDCKDCTEINCKMQKN